jgi:transcriptional regulator with XRE-family HTH domain
MGGAQRPVGGLLRQWRHRRGRSQMDLAHDAGVSPRHLSFVETGRSNPSPDLILTLADLLEIPLRDRNVLLLSAGYAPRYPRSPLSDASMTTVRRALWRIVSNHEPYPGIVIDGLWNSVLSNEAAIRIVEDLPADVVGPPTNVFRVCLHPNGLAKRTLNFEEWGTYLLGQLRRLVALTDDAEAQQLADEVLAYPTVTALGGWGRPPFVAPEPELLVPWRLEIGRAELSYFTTLAVFGTPQDITLAELAIELFYPADKATEEAVRAGW